MIEVEIPGYHTLRLSQLVLDYNGTMAVDGKLIAGVPELLARLADDLQIHVVTADTFGKATPALGQMPCQVTILPAAHQAQAKLKYVQKLEANRVVAVGNGRNDARMLKEAGLGIAVVQQEGAAFEALAAADVICPTVNDALELFLNPLRLKATLRS